MDRIAAAARRDVRPISAWKQASVGNWDRVELVLCISVQWFAVSLSRNSGVFTFLYSILLVSWPVVCHISPSRNWGQNPLVHAEGEKPSSYTDLRSFTGVYPFSHTQSLIPEYISLEIHESIHVYPLQHAGEIRTAAAHSHQTLCPSRTARGLPR